jgi:hydrogenase expression/formation protein HypC
MCLALPAKVTAVHDDGSAMVELGGIKQRVSVALLDDVKVDEFLIIHVGYAISKLDPEVARKTLAELASLQEVRS